MKNEEDVIELPSSEMIFLLRFLFLDFIFFFLIFIGSVNNVSKMFVGNIILCLIRCKLYKPCVCDFIGQSRLRVFAVLYKSINMNIELISIKTSINCFKKSVKFVNNDFFGTQQLF